MKTMMTRTVIGSASRIGAATFVMLSVLSCGKSSTTDPSPSDQMKAILTSGTWKLQTVLVDGADKTSTYTGLTLNFTGTSYSSTNGRVIWPAGGGWQFADETGTHITRDDGLPVAIGDASASKLVLTLTWTKTTLGGRGGSLKGVNIFTFGK
jgi:hypothetical protein